MTMRYALSFVLAILIAPVAFGEFPDDVGEVVEMWATPAEIEDINCPDASDCTFSLWVGDNQRATVKIDPIWVGQLEIFDTNCPARDGSYSSKMRLSVRLNEDGSYEAVRTVVVGTCSGE